MPPSSLSSLSSPLNKKILVVVVFSSLFFACEDRGERRASNGAPAPSPSPSTTAATPTPMPTPTPTPSPAPTPTPTPTPSASANGGNPATAEVEIFGKIILPAGAPKDGKLVVYVAQDDCMKNDAQVLGHIPAATTTGSFAIEVFPKWGTDVTICGALEDASGSATFSGKAVSKEAGGVFHAEKLGEVTFNNVEITLKKGPAHKFPREAN